MFFPICDNKGAKLKNSKNCINICVKIARYLKEKKIYTCKRSFISNLKLERGSMKTFAVKMGLETQAEMSVRR